MFYEIETNVSEKILHSLFKKVNVISLLNLMTKIITNITLLLYILAFYWTL